MKKYLNDYIEEIDILLNSDKKINDEIIRNHLTKIEFFQHERLIHLLVTLFYVIFFLIFAGLAFVHYIFFPIAIILIVFLFFYVIHYFRLENGVQYLYKQYDVMLKKKDKGSSLYERIKRLIRYKQQ